MRFVVAVGLLFAGQAYADESMVLGEKASNCLTIGPDDLYANRAADFDVIVGSDGTVTDVRVTSYRPEDEASKDFVRRASAAIERCLTTYDVPPGAHKVHMNAFDDYETIPPKALIDPFKK